jgi:hypothetical protein
LFPSSLRMNSGANANTIPLPGFTTPPRKAAR